MPFKSDKQRKYVFATLRKNRVHPLNVAYSGQLYLNAPMSLDRQIEKIVSKLGGRETGAGFGFGERDISYEFPDAKSKNRAARSLESLGYLHRGKPVDLTISSESSYRYPLLTRAEYTRVQRYVKSRPGLMKLVNSFGNRALSVESDRYDTPPPRPRGVKKSKRK